MLTAAIDAGSNTLRLLIGRVADGRVVPVSYHRRICRLAGGATSEQGLQSEAKQRTLAVFREFAGICRSTGVTRIKAVGTAAFRQNINGADFADEVRQDTGLPLEIISGDEEAAYTATGILSALSPVPEASLIIDIGGGSTEFIVCHNRRTIWSSSVPLGVVTLTERCADAARRQQAIAREIDAVMANLQDQCAQAGLSPGTLSLVGTAGTVTTLAALDMKMTDYDGGRVNNHVMSAEVVASWRARMLPMTPDRREALPGMEPGRGDVIIAGLDIILCLMRMLPTDRLIASDSGILEGLLIARQNRTEDRPSD